MSSLTATSSCQPDAEAIVAADSEHQRVAEEVEVAFVEHRGVRVELCLQLQPAPRAPADAREAAPDAVAVGAAERSPSPSRVTAACPNADQRSAEAMLTRDRQRHIDAPLPVSSCASPDGNLTAQPDARGRLGRTRAAA